MAALQQPAPEPAPPLDNAKARYRRNGLASQLRALKVARSAERKTQNEVRKELRKKLTRAKATIKEQGIKLVRLTKESSQKLASFMLLAEEEIPPAMVHLRHLLNNNMAVLSSKGQRRCLWHPAVLEACCVIFSSSRAAYAEMYQSGLAALPTPDCIRKLTASAVTSSTGQDVSLYKSVGKEVAEWPDKFREAVLVYDEVDLVGKLAFKKVGKCFCFFGMVDDPGYMAVFSNPNRKERTPFDMIREFKAKAALVFQCVFVHDTFNEELSTERVVRRVVGVHAVSSPPAEVVEAITTETIANLDIYAGVRVIATVSDGASAFRLQQKKATSGKGRGTANIFVSSERFDDTRPDSVINMMSDISHLIKKAVTILHTSSPTSKSRFLMIPDYLVQIVFSTRPFPGQPAGRREIGETVGLEAYLYMWGRVFELMGSADQPAWFTSNPATDLRIQELEDILKWFEMWHDFNTHAISIPEVSYLPRLSPCDAHGDRCLRRRCIHRRLCRHRLDAGGTWHGESAWTDARDLLRPPWLPSRVSECAQRYG